jgi:zinc protease
MEKISSNITELEHAGMRFFASRTGARDLVTILGSTLGGWNMLPLPKSEVPAIAAELMDAGTTKHTKNQIREALAERGASLSFSAGGDRIHFSGSCLPEDVTFLLAMIVECLSEASFPSSEVKTAKERTLADIEEEKNETRSIASGALSRLLYDAEHVNYADSLPTRKKKVENVTRADLISFRKMLSQQGMVVALTGDVQPTVVLAEAKKIFTKLHEGSIAVPQKKKNAKKQTEAVQHIHIADKANIDVYMGISLPITYEDQRFIPLMVMCDMLGGRGFTSHLMSTVRERDGLTYGVYTMPSGFADLAEGDFRVWATFSPQKYNESVKVLRREMEVFFKEKVTEEKLAKRKTEMQGGYKVSLSTSRGLASMLRRIGVEGKDIGYLDEYPELIEAVTVEDLQKAAALIDLKNLSLAAAGTFLQAEKKGTTKKELQKKGAAKKRPGKRAKK